MKKEEFFAISLPYGLKTIRRITNDELPIYSIIGLSYGNMNLCRVQPEVGRDYLLPICDVMPILHPLSDLTKEIEHNGEKFVPIDELNNIGDAECDRYNDYFNEENISDVNWLLEPFIIFQKLIEWHFDIADLISKGEAIDVNTLEINPYK